jgi:XTP/dITP diphosphohydrolase
MGGPPRLLIATTNAGKLREISSLLAGVPFELVFLGEVGIDVDIAETGSTFAENARIKASAYLRLSGMLTLAEDSGLEVDALGGRPGVLSARFAGEGATDRQNVALLLEKLNDIGDSPWDARFRAVVAIASPKGDVELHEGEVRGRIVNPPRGSNGFGYDPVFAPDGMDRTTAELPPEEKDRISHRGSAVRKAAAALRRRKA